MKNNISESDQLQKLNCVFQLISERAQLMKSVAAEKYIKKDPLYAPRREVEILQQIEQLAKKHTLPIYPTLAFAQIQMDMSKLIEQYWVDVWSKSKGEVIPKQPDLQQLRERITKIDLRLYLAIYNALAILITLEPSIIQRFFEVALKNVEGIPLDSNYKYLLLSSLMAIAQAHP